MVLCKFYAQGNCRYGNNCNFEHTNYRETNKYSLNNTGINNRENQQSNSYNQQSRIPRYNENYNYRSDARQSNNYQSSNQQSNLFSRLTTNNQQHKPPAKQIDPENIDNEQDFLDLISNDFKQWLESSTFWKFSSYKFNKKAVNLPILEDFSEEEARHALYEAKKQNHYTEGLQQFQMKYNQVLETIKQIAEPNRQTTEYLIKYFHESANKQNETKTKPAVNPFAQIIQKKQQELKNQPVQQNQPFFSQNSTASVQGFLQQQQTNQIQTSGSFLFTDQAQQKPTNLFASIASSQQPTNPFTKLATSASPSIFNTQSGFTSTQNTGGLFNQPTFSSFPQTAVGSLAVNPLNSFSTNIQTSQIEPDVNPNPKVYSDLSELNENDIKEYKENKFTLGLIPHLPPTKQLCM